MPWLRYVSNRSCCVCVVTDEISGHLAVTLSVESSCFWAFAICFDGGKCWCHLTCPPQKMMCIWRRGRKSRINHHIANVNGCQDIANPMHTRSNNVWMVTGSSVNIEALHYPAALFYLGIASQKTWYHAAPHFAIQSHTLWVHGLDELAAGTFIILPAFCLQPLLDHSLPWQHASCSVLIFGSFGWKLSVIPIDSLKISK